MAKTCATCRFFTAYYEKAYSCFLRTNCGNCAKRGGTVQKKEKCEMWQNKNTIKRKKGLVLRELDGAAADLSAIRLILEDMEEDEKF